MYFEKAYLIMASSLFGPPRQFGQLPNRLWPDNRELRVERFAAREVENRIDEMIDTNGAEWQG